MSIMAAEQNVSPGTIALMMTEADEEKGTHNQDTQIQARSLLLMGDLILGSLTSHSEQHDYPSEVPKKALSFFSLSAYFVRNN